MDIIPGLVLCTQNRKELFGDADSVGTIFIQQKGTDKVESWTCQLVIK